MRGDFSRDSFDPRKHYSGVRQQQGRVQLDADWNEQGDILRHALRVLARDLIGPHGGPADRLGFANLADESALLPMPAARLECLRAALARGEVLIGAGRYYVDGIATENDDVIALSEQPGFTEDERRRLDATAHEPALFYLDIWERLVTAIEDHGIREVALGGPDTATRSQVMWRVRILLASHIGAPLDKNALDRMPRVGTGLTSASAPNGYTGAENQLYRIEIHRGGKAGGEAGATFKWSRDNGALSFAVTGVAVSDATHAVIRLAPGFGHAERRPKPGDIVELIGDREALADRPGSLLTVESVENAGAPLTVRVVAPDDLTRGIAMIANDRHALLRVWDHPAADGFNGAVPVVEQDDPSHGGIVLENGIEIGFARGGCYHAGDYWQVPARAATSAIEWPSPTDAGAPTSRPPRGPVHAFAPLAFRRPGGRLEDCRRRIGCAAVDDGGRR